MSAQHQLYESKLACPVCHGKFLDGLRDAVQCEECSLIYPVMNGTYNLVPPGILNDSRFQFELERYDQIAVAGLRAYPGYLATRPKERAELIADLLRAHQVKEFVEVGPGFGSLLDRTRGLKRTAVELSTAFLTHLAVRLGEPDMCLVKGVAEYLPLASGTVPCLVMDGTFQSIVDRERFLYEVSRICAPGAMFVFTVAYGHNYPRRPQNGFNVNRPDELETLRHFLEELGFDMEFRYRDLGAGKWVQIKDEGDYLYMVGRKS